MDKFNTHQVTMGIKKSIKQQNSKQKRHIAPKSKEFRSWILRKVIDNGKNNSLNIWILDNPQIWGTHLNRREVVMLPSLARLYSASASPSERLRSDSLLAIKRIENFAKDLEVRRDLGNRAHLKRPFKENFWSQKIQVALFWNLSFPGSAARWKNKNLT